MRGVNPTGLTLACGASIITGSPRCTPSASARSCPRTMPKSPGCKSARDPVTIWPATSDTDFSAAGSMPRTWTPRSTCPRKSMPCAATKGAAARTEGDFSAASAISVHLASTEAGSAPGTKSSMCGRTESMRSRTSFWKPFMTDSTTISAATPSAIPAIDVAATKETNRSRPPRRPRMRDNPA